MAITQEQAEQLEWQRLVARLNELESILGLHTTNPRFGEWARVRDRIRRLAGNAGLRINPEDDETQLDPIILGEWLDAQASNDHPIWR